MNSTEGNAVSQTTAPLPPHLGHAHTAMTILSVSNFRAEAETSVPWEVGWGDVQIRDRASIPIRPPGSGLGVVCMCVRTIVYLGGGGSTV